MTRALILDHDTALDDDRDVLEHLHPGKRIVMHRDQVGKVTGRQLADVRRTANQVSGPNRGSLDRLCR